MVVKSLNYYLDFDFNIVGSRNFQAYLFEISYALHPLAGYYLKLEPLSANEEDDQGEMEKNNSNNDRMVSNMMEKSNNNQNNQLIALASPNIGDKSAASNYLNTPNPNSDIRNSNLKRGKHPLSPTMREHPDSVFQFKFNPMNSTFIGDNSNIEG